VKSVLRFLFSIALAPIESNSENLKSLLQKSWHGHLAREKRLFSWQIPAMNHGQDARATLFASPFLSRCHSGHVIHFR
jgi:hypothetical protein